MSPINARRALLVQQWLIYDACVQIPQEWCASASIVLEAGRVFWPQVSIWWARLETGQPKTLNEMIRSTRNLGTRL